MTGGQVPLFQSKFFFLIRLRSRLDPLLLARIITDRKPAQMQFSHKDAHHGSA